MSRFAALVRAPVDAWRAHLPAAGVARYPRSRQLLREVGLVAVLFGLYNVGRLLAAERVSGAFDNADGLWQLERWLRLPSEQALQAVALDVPELIRAANGYYASVHFPLTFLVLLWLFLRKPDRYLWARRSLVWGSAAALVVQVFVPMAPPRMLTNLGFVDTGVRYGQSVYGTVGQDPLANQFAAMPSLHVGWAVLLAVVCIRSGHSRLRWVWVLHPILTTMVVVVTANHYWLDGVVGALLIVGALWLTARQQAARQVEVATAPASPAAVQELPAGGVPVPDLLPTQRRATSLAPPGTSDRPPTRHVAEEAVPTGRG